MKQIGTYNFHRTKYGSELLIDIVQLKDIKKFLHKNAIHRLTYYDITLITGGNGEFSIDDYRCLVQKGDVIFSCPGQMRNWDIENISDGYALIFEEEFLLSFFNDPNFIKNLSYFGKIKRTDKLTLAKEEVLRITGLLLEIKKEIEHYDKKDKHILRALLYQILKLLDRINVNKTEYNNPIRNRYVDHFIEIVNRCYAENHSSSFYAGQLCITPNYLNELVKKETGINAKQFINNKIIHEAKRQLLYTNVSITEIAASLYFESPSYFVRFFKKQTGFTPHKYRIDNKP